ncbi:DUF4382 domain-containing protein [Roseisolibacter agri]|uniref:DUF4382 domain-containing protein n=1 Tax=Roseisolibacter agri TaxID=2014610 RepID=A0AA37Q4M3_9BACT|nr:DUF4382 domain-containing protein [Roseisolibacter agri]GLC23687.1 hypothetical protein rosag_02000 [Roseisolibacter agri]
MPLSRSMRLGACAALLAGSAIACGDDAFVDGQTGPRGSGRLVVQLTDAPFPFDSVKSVDVYVVRVDAKAEATDSAAAAVGTADSTKDSGGWVTLAEPKAKFDLLTLRDGKFATLGEKGLPAGTYRSFRLIIDPAQSRVTMKSGDSVAVQWPSAGRSGIKLQLAKDVTVGKDSTTALLVDFDVGESFVMRGNSLKNGLLFKPVIKAATR